MKKQLIVRKYDKNTKYKTNNNNTEYENNGLEHITID